MRPVRATRLSGGGAARRAAAGGHGSESPSLLPVVQSDADDSPFPSPIKRPRRSDAVAATSTGMGMKRSRSGRQVRPPTSRDELDGTAGDDDDDDDDEGPIRRSRVKRQSLWNAKAPGRGGETNGTAASKSSARSSVASSSRSTPSRKDDAKAKTAAAAKASAASTAKQEETRAKEEERERKMLEKWAEEYYEIVEQLPLELHRSFTLMRELETKLQGRISLVAAGVKEYRDARIALRNLAPEQKAQLAKEEAEAVRPVPAPAAPLSETGRATSSGSQRDVQEMLMQGSSTDADAEGEDAAEVYHELAGEAYEPEPFDEPQPASAQELQHESARFSSLAEPDVRSSAPAGAAAEVQVANDDVAGPSSTFAHSRAARHSLLADIAQASSEALRIADEKIGLAVTAYEWVDRQIRRLDGDLQKSENGLLLGLRAGTEASRGLQDALGVNLDGSGDKNAPGRWDEVEMLLLGHPAAEKSAVAQRKGKKGARKGGRKAANAKAEPEVDADEEEATGMAIDPNEPTYCYCDQVSFGDMIACDNEDCPREWFHYHCVGFSQPPKGRWFCLFCAPAVGFKGAGAYPPDAPCLPDGMAKKSAGGTRGRKRK